MRRVLVTGAAGNMGTAMLELLAARQVPVTALVLEGAAELSAPADRTVVGNAGDLAVARDAVRDAEAVIHLAALPTPRHGTPTEVFGGNSQATLAVFEEAAQAGIRRVAYASSYSVLGLAWSPRELHPAYLPIDERLPLQVEDPYALSKQADEATATMMWRRYGVTSVGLRFPFMAPRDVIAERARQQAADPATGAREMWTYLDIRDAARAAWLAVTAPMPAGAHVAYAMAPQTLVPYPTEELLDTYHPGVHRSRTFPGRTAPVDLSAARELFGFEAEHLLPIEPREG